MTTKRRQLLFILAAMVAVQTAAALPLYSKEIGEESTDDGPHNFPLQETEEDDGRAALYGNHFEGDIIISEEELETYYDIPRSDETDHNVSVNNYNIKMHTNAWP